MAKPARTRHVEGTIGDDCAETLPFWIDLGSFLTWLYRRWSDFTDESSYGDPRDGGVNIIPIAAVAHGDPYWDIGVISESDVELQLYATEVPISARSAKHGRGYYRTRAGVPGGLRLPIWSGPELSVFDEDPFYRMRKNPAGVACEHPLVFFVALGDFAKWLQGRTLPGHQHPFDAIGIEDVAGSRNTDPSVLIHTYRIKGSQIVSLKQLYGLYHPLTRPQYYFPIGDRVFLEDSRASLPRSLQQPVFAARNSALTVYSSDPWDRVTV